MSDVFAEGEARILDRGFRNYHGPRERFGPIRTVVEQGIQRGLGFRRKPTAKVLPFLAVAVGYIPAIVLIGMATMFRSGADIDLDIPSYSEYFSSIFLSIVLLTALVAPEVFGNDQKTGMLGIYLASPLTRGSYLLAKAASVATILALITLGPQLLLLIANTVQGVGPDGPWDWFVVFLRIVASGLAVGALLTSVSVAITIVTNNKGIAIAGIVVVLFVVAGLGVGVAEVSEIDALWALSLLDIMFALPTMIHGERLSTVTEIQPAVAWVGFVVWVGVCSTVAWVRMQRLEVTR